MIDQLVAGQRQVPVYETEIPVRYETASRPRIGNWLTKQTGGQELGYG